MIQKMVPWLMAELKGEDDRKERCDVEQDNIRFRTVTNQFQAFGCTDSIGKLPSVVMIFLQNVNMMIERI